MHSVRNRYGWASGKLPMPTRSVNWLTAGVLLCVLAMFSACVSRENAAEVAKAGISASDSLANYYGSLAEQATQTRELEAFFDSLKQNNLAPVSQAEVDKTM